MLADKGILPVLGTDIDVKNGYHRLQGNHWRWEPQVQQLQLRDKARDSVVAAKAPRDSATKDVE